jgi:hypothetical protein
MWIFLLLLAAPLAAVGQGVAAQALPVTQTAAYNPRQVRVDASHCFLTSRERI